MKPGAAHVNPGGLERRAGTDDHLVARRVLVDDVQRLTGGDPDPAPLADGEPVLAVVSADDVALAVDDRPGGVAELAVASQEPGAIGAGEEAQVLGVDLARRPAARPPPPSP